MDIPAQSGTDQGPTHGVGVDVVVVQSCPMLGEFALTTLHGDNPYLGFREPRHQSTCGRLGAITGPENPGDLTGTRQLLLYEYLGGKVWKRKSGNGLEARYFETTNAPLYDHVGRLLGVRYVDGYGTSPGPAEFRYGYDRVGNRTYEQRRHETLTNPANSFRTRTYKSDLLGRLEKWKERALTSGDLVGLRTALDPTDNPITPTDAEAWQLDKVGNWLTHSTGTSQTPPTDNFIANELNQYTQVTIGGNAKPFTFDWLGQLRQDDSKLQPQKYEWDMFGRLTRVIRVSNSTEIARYRYDALNRRVEKQTSSVSEPTTRYVYDGWRSIEERVVVSSTEQVKARYGFGLSLDEVIWMDRASGSGENPPPPIDGRYFFAQDGLGSVIAATDDRAQGQPLVVSERYTYGAYGERSAWTGAAWDSGAYTATQGNASVIGMPFGFTGHRLDAETGLSYFRNRYYDPETGRFARRDLLGYSDGPNLYQYARSAPSMFVDSLGLASTPSETAQVNEMLRWQKVSAGGPGYCLCNYSAAPGGARTDLQRWRSEMAASSLGGDTGFGGRNLVVDDGSHMQTLTDQEMQAMGATRNKELGYWEKDGRPISNLMDVQGFAGITLSDIGGALFRNVVYDYQNPLFGSHLAEAATLIPGGKLFKWGGKGVKWARRLFRAEEAAEAAAKVTRATHLIPTHGSTLSRRAFQELKESIARDGIREPIKFVEVNGQKFVVDGHHRLRAARELGIVDVPIERVELPYAGYNTIDDLLPW